MSLESQLSPGATTSAPVIIVSSKEQLLEALRRPGSAPISVEGIVSGLPSVTLAPGQSLEARGAHAELVFLPEHDGLRLTCDNRVGGLTLTAAPQRRALFNDSTIEAAGSLSLSDLRLCGQLQILARGKLQRGWIDIDGVEVIDADTRARDDLASGNGVSVLQGAITIWNQQVAASALTATLRNVRVGSPERPVRGGGLFLSGSGPPGGGRLELANVDVESVYADSALAEGTTELVAAAVFILHNARAKRVGCRGLIQTFGPNCVALDNWGEVDEWVAESDVCTQGPSAVAIVNAGVLRRLSVAGRVETYGQGARCVSIYTETDTLEFSTLRTSGDGATAIQITRPLKRLLVSGSIETRGGNGSALVKGKVETLSADCIEIEPGGRIEELAVRGPLRTYGAGMSVIRARSAQGIGTSATNAAAASMAAF